MKFFFNLVIEQLDLVVTNRFKNLRHVKSRQRAVDIIQIPTIRQKLLHGHLFLHLWIVLICVEHDDGVATYEDRIRASDRNIILRLLALL